MIRNRLHELKLETTNETIEVEDDSGKDDKLHQQLNKSLKIRESLKSLRDEIDSLKNKLSQGFHYNDKIIQMELVHLDNAVLKNFFGIASSIKKLNQEWLTQCDSQTMARIMINELSYLNTEYYYVFENYTMVYDLHEKSCRKVLKRESEILSKDIYEEAEKLLSGEEREASLFTDNILVGTQKAKEELQGIIERNEQLSQIEKALEQVRELFIQMSVLIKSQGFVIKEIENRTEDTTNNIDKAKADVNKARDYYTKGSKRKLYIIAVLVFFLLLILIIVLS